MKQHFKSDDITYRYSIEVLKQPRGEWKGIARQEKTFGNAYSENTNILEFTGFSEEQVRERLLKAIEEQKVKDREELANLAESYIEEIE